MCLGAGAGDSKLSEDMSYLSVLYENKFTQSFINNTFYRFYHFDVIEYISVT